MDLHKYNTTEMIYVTRDNVLENSPLQSNVYASDKMCQHSASIQYLYFIGTL